ncbi:hypothetical protein C8Q74DRAFT_1267134 [Fomes fomentarius]|nr:hypothetical protein C8Q74DRAFT_1267134 [Fomes fomentarius]
MPSSLLFLPLLLYALTANVLRAASQGTNAVCEAGFEWMSNSKGQSPCLISSYLFTPCASAAASWVYPLSPGFHYNTPLNNSASASPCRCNTVLFSTIAACATCQGQEDYVIPWSTYARNCSTVYVQKYPEPIPAGTAVPAWAYIDITANNTFDPEAAQALANQDAPESTASVKPSSTSGSLAGSPSETQSSNGAPQAGGNSSSSKSSNIGPIVGGVVGGVVGLIAIGLAIFFFLRYKRNRADHQAPTGPLDLTGGTGGYTQYAQYPQYPQYEEKSPTQEVTQPLVANQSPRLYDPNDPSTFPTADAYAGSVPASGYATDPSLHSAGYGQPGTGPQSSMATNQNSTYRGAPEL